MPTPSDHVSADKDNPLHAARLHVIGWLLTLPSKKVKTLIACPFLLFSACRPIKPKPTRPWRGPTRKASKRASAVAEEQDMQARIEQSRAEVVEAEAAVPRAMAEAFRSRKLMILDYYKLQNVAADTEMGKSLAGQGVESANINAHHHQS